MKLVILASLLVVGTSLPTAAMAGGPMSLAIDGSAMAPPIVRAVFGDGPPTGAHRGRKHHGAETPKDTGPSKIDMHGATREGADQEYRKKYGF